MFYHVKIACYQYAHELQCKYHTRMTINEVHFTKSKKFTWKCNWLIGHIISINDILENWLLSHPMLMSLHRGNIHSQMQPGRMISHHKACLLTKGFT